MTGLLTVLIGSLGLGAALALVGIRTGAAVGWVGAVALLGWILWLRLRWSQSRQAPDAPERPLWLRAAGLGLVLGHLSTILMHPRIDLHIGAGNALAFDSWTLTAALLIALVMFRKDARISDERHRQVVAHGIRAAYVTLVALVVILSLVLGFAPPYALGAFDLFDLANVLVALVLAAYLVQQLVQLTLYRKDREPDEADA
jgi:hypothetical protein